MKEQVFFLNMFPDLAPPEELQEALSQAAIVAADIDPAARRVSVAMHSPIYIPRRYLSQISEEIQTSYGLRHLELTATHPGDQLTSVEPEELMELFVNENSMHRGALAGARWEWEGTQLMVKLVGNGVKELEESAVAVCRDLRERFAVPVTICFEAGPWKMFGALSGLTCIISVAF